MTEKIKGFNKINNIGNGRTQNDNHPWRKETVKALSEEIQHIEKTATKKTNFEELFNQLTELQWAKELVRLEGGRTRIKYKKKLDQELNAYVDNEEEWFLYTRAGK